MQLTKLDSPNKVTVELLREIIASCHLLGMSRDEIVAHITSDTVKRQVSLQAAFEVV